MLHVLLAASHAILLVTVSAQGPAERVPEKVAAEVARPLAKGMEQYNAGRFAEAAETLREAAAQKPEDPELHYRLGDAYSALSDYPRAREAYTRALSLKPGYAPASNNLAMARMKSGDFEGGLKMLEALTDADPAFALAHYNLGAAYVENGDRNGALRQQMILRLIDPPRAYRLTNLLVKSGPPIKGVPFNAKPLTLPAPSMGPVAEKAFGRGEVRVMITVDPSGSVDKARALVGDRLLREQAVKAAIGTRFTPVLVDGEPARVTGVLTYGFRRGQPAKVTVPTHVMRP